ncbi:hypothetical protein J2Y58_002829 [Sphingomonas sp. BE138]|nr:hypothetical protein [Sphingomonas sp. BE138]MDR6789456.1 hypothetical protein [Sphingomonas sp. BE138]
MPLRSDELPARTSRLADIVVWVIAGAACGVFWRELVELLLRLFR